MILEPGALLHKAPKGIAGAPPVAEVPPLDGITATAAAAYSFRKLRAAYAGSAVTVRRSSDNATQNIGFDAQGNFHEPNYAAFVGLSTGTLASWFDQTVNATAASQGNNPRQPTIGSYEGFYGGHGQDQGSQSVQTPDVLAVQNIFSGVGGGFVIMVVTLDAQPAGLTKLCGKNANGWTFQGNARGLNISLWFRLQGTSGPMGDWETKEVVPISRTHVVDVAFDASGTYTTPAVITVDGVVDPLVTSNGYGGTAASDVGDGLMIWNSPYSIGPLNAWEGAIYEAMFFKGMPSAADQSALRANLKTYYNTP
jgi:hypothetical protein